MGAGCVWEWHLVAATDPRPSPPPPSQRVSCMCGTWLPRAGLALKEPHGPSSLPLPATSFGGRCAPGGRCPSLCLVRDGEIAEGGPDGHREGQSLPGRRDSALFPALGAACCLLSGGLSPSSSGGTGAVSAGPPREGAPQPPAPPAPHFGGCRFEGDPQPHTRLLGILCTAPRTAHQGTDRSRPGRGTASSACGHLWGINAGAARINAERGKTGRLLREDRLVPATTPEP